ncbi:hypothetical protein B0F90DRAFT_1753957, partial [Multifurca ochricompacta]
MHNMFLQILSQVNSIIFSLFISHSFFGFKGLFSVSVHFSFDNINITLSYLYYIVPLICTQCTLWFG